MIKHIVFLKLKPIALGNTKIENLNKIKEMLEILPSKINLIKKFEVGVDFYNTEFSADIALYSEFETKADLEAYQIHPEHLKVLEFIKQCINERRVADYMI